MRAHLEDDRTSARTVYSTDIGIITVFLDDGGTARAHRRPDRGQVQVEYMYAGPKACNIHLSSIEPNAIIYSGGSYRSFQNTNSRRLQPFSLDSLITSECNRYRKVSDYYCMNVEHIKVWNFTVESFLMSVLIVKIICGRCNFSRLGWGLRCNLPEQ